MSLYVTAAEYAEFNRSLKASEMVYGRLVYEKTKNAPGILMIDEYAFIKDTLDESQRPLADAIKAQRPKIFWVTISLGAGVQEMTGRIDDFNPKFLLYKEPSSLEGPDTATARGEGRQWHRTLEAAQARLEEMRQAKMATLRKNIVKLKNMGLPFPARAEGDPAFSEDRIFWVTRNLDEGILKVSRTDTFAFDPSCVLTWHVYGLPHHAFNEGRDWHRTRAAADARMEVMRQAKIASLTKSLEKLEATDPTVQPKPKTQKRLTA